MLPDARTDAQLIVDARTDPQAFREIYERYAVWMRSWFQRQTGSEAASLDLTAETFAQAWRGLKRFRDMADGSAAPWLFGIARNLLRQYHKHNRIETAARARLGLPIDWEGTEAYDAVDERIHANTLKPALTSAVKALPDDQRAALQLRVIDQLGYDEISARLGCSINAARLRVSRALRALMVDMRGLAVRRPLPPELVLLGDHLEVATRRALGRRRTRRQMVLNAVTSVAVALPLLPAVLGLTAGPVQATPEVVEPRRAGVAAARDDFPPRALSRPKRVWRAARRALHAAEGAAVSLLMEDPRLAERARCVSLIRESLGVLSSKWAVGVLLALGEGPRRYHQILTELNPISEKVLTQTLRTMERDGLIARHVHAEVPPRVEYELTRLGASMAVPMKALGNWAVANGSRVASSRERYDAVNA